VPNCTLLLSELGQLAQNAMLGVAAVCGNSSATSQMPQRAMPVRDVLPPPAISAPDTDYLQAIPLNGDDQLVLGRQKAAPTAELSRLQQVVLQQNGVRSSGGYYSFGEKGGSNSTAISTSSHSFMPEASDVAGQTVGGRRGVLANLMSGTSQQATAGASDGFTVSDITVDLSGTENVGIGNEIENDSTVPRGGLTVTGGYSSVEGVSVGGKIARSNIWGPQSELSASARYSKIRTLFELNFEGRNFLGSGFRFAPTIFNNRISATGFGTGIGRTPFSQSARGFNVILNRKFADGLSATLNYRLSNDVLNVRKKNGPCDAAIFGSPICSEIGDRTNSILSLGLSFDEKFYVQGNKRRFRLQLTQDLSVGGSASFSRTRLISQAHVGLGSGLSFTFDAEGGYIAPMNGDRIPLFERFYIGDSSMRGFDFRGIGPKIRPTAAKAGQNVAIGGQAYYVARSELSANLNGTVGRLGFQPGLFVDVGSVFAAGKNRLLPGETLIGNSPKPRVSVGVGLALGTPAGKLRLDFVKPLVKQQGDRAKFFAISFGKSI
jgi:outer membrane protein assembly factor BamA